MGLNTSRNKNGKCGEKKGRGEGVSWIRTVVSIGEPIDARGYLKFFQGISDNIA